MAGLQRCNAAMRLVVLFIASLFRISAAQMAGIITCRGFNGGNHTGNFQCPGSNACCGTQGFCLSNRLCRNPAHEEGVFVRAPCLNFPFDDTYAQICLYDEPSPGGLLPRVRLCTDGKLCCDNDPQCCEKGRGVFLDEGGKVVSARATAATTTYGVGRVTVTMSISTDPTPTSQTTSSTSSSDSTQRPGSAAVTESAGGSTIAENASLKAGLGVGISLAILVTAGGVYFWVKKRRTTSSAAVTDSERPTQPQPVSHAYTPPLAPKEVDGGYYSGFSQSSTPTPRLPVELGPSTIQELGTAEKRRYELL